MNFEEYLKPMSIEINWIIVMVISGALSAIGAVAHSLFHHLYKKAFPDNREAVDTLLAVIQNSDNWSLELDNYNNWDMTNPHFQVTIRPNKSISIRHAVQQGTYKTFKTMEGLFTSVEKSRLEKACFTLLKQLQDRALNAAMTNVEV